MTKFGSIKRAGLALFFACIPASMLWAQSLVHVGTFEWPSESHVGLSGLEVSENGVEFKSISDQGWFLAGSFVRNEGIITAIDLQSFLPILGNDGLPVSARRIGDWSDAEGLAIANDGTYWISFERWAHVSQYTAPTQTGQWIKDHPSFSKFKDNRQLEALAIHPDGSLYSFSEQPLRQGFPIFRLLDGAWDIQGYLPKNDGFAIVGADFDNSGRLFLLERKLVLGLWWQNRIRLVQFNEPITDEILWTGQRGEYYNLEGIAVWPAGDGLRITMVSDNNADLDEPTQFVEYLLIE